MKLTNWRCSGGRAFARGLRVRERVVVMAGFYCQLRVDYDAGRGSARSCAARRAAAARGRISSF